MVCLHRVLFLFPQQEWRITSNCFPKRGTANMIEENRCIESDIYLSEVGLRLRIVDQINRGLSIACEKVESMETSIFDLVNYFEEYDE